MNKIMYSIRDKKAGFYYTPVIFENDAVAIRSFGDLITRDKESIISQHPTDFSLCRIGTFDNDTGLLSPTDVVVLADGDNFATK